MVWFELCFLTIQQKIHIRISTHPWGRVYYFGIITSKTNGSKHNWSWTHQPGILQQGSCVFGKYAEWASPQQLQANSRHLRQQHWSTIAAPNVQYSQRTKHCAVRLYFQQGLIMEGTISVHNVSSANELTDIFTKHINRLVFNRILQTIADKLNQKTNKKWQEQQQQGGTLLNINLLLWDSGHYAKQHHNIVTNLDHQKD